jgi:hypothetical protein
LFLPLFFPPEDVGEGVVGGEDVLVGALVGERVIGAEGMGFLPLPPPFFAPPLSRCEEAGIFSSAEITDTRREKIEMLANFILDELEGEEG